MTTRDAAKAQAFVDYALDTEGMKFAVTRTGDKYRVRPAKGTSYDPQVVTAVTRNFQQEWRMFS
jgi:ABC-type Fe3+ transport system substrate-binding protein